MRAPCRSRSVHYARSVIFQKHMEEPGKREIALRAMTFFAFASDDGDIRDRSISRLEAVLGITGMADLSEVCSD